LLIVKLKLALEPLNELALRLDVAPDGIPETEIFVVVV